MKEELSFHAILYRGRKKYSIESGVEKYFSLVTLDGWGANVLQLKGKKISFGINKYRWPSGEEVIKTKKSEFHKIPEKVIGVTIKLSIVPDLRHERAYRYEVVWAPYKS